MLWIKFKEKPDAKWDKGRGGLRGRLHTTKLPVRQKELRKSLGSERNHRKQKAGEDVFKGGSHFPVSLPPPVFELAFQPLL